MDRTNSNTPDTPERRAAIARQTKNAKVAELRAESRRHRTDGHINLADSYSLLADLLQGTETA